MKNNAKELHTIRRMVGQNIYRERQAKQISLHALARHCEISILKLDHYEIGKNSIQIEDICRIAKALNIHAYELIKPTFPINHT